MKSYKEQIEDIRGYNGQNLDTLYHPVDEVAVKLNQIQELRDRDELMELGGFDQEEVDELTWEEVKTSLSIKRRHNQEFGSGHGIGVK